MADQMEETTKDLHLLGVSFRTAPVAVRKSLSFNRSEAADLLQGPAARGPELEALVLSTCNRTEFYLAAPREAGAVETMLAHLRRIRPQAPILRSDCLRSRRNRAGAGRARALLVERMGALHGLVDGAKRVRACDLRKPVGGRLIGHGAPGFDVSPVRNRHPHHRSRRFDHTPPADVGLEDQRLHPDEGIVLDPGRPMNVGLMRERNPVSDVNRIPLPVHLVGVLRARTAVFNRLQGVDHHPVLKVRLIADMNRLPFVATRRRKRRQINAAPDLHVPNHARQRIHPSRGIDREVLEVRIEIGRDVPPNQPALGRQGRRRSSMTLGGLVPAPVGRAGCTTLADLLQNRSPFFRLRLLDRATAAGSEASQQNHPGTADPTESQRRYFGIHCDASFPFSSFLKRNSCFPLLLRSFRPPLPDLLHAPFSQPKDDAASARNRHFRTHRSLPPARACAAHAASDPPRCPRPPPPADSPGSSRPTAWLRTPPRGH